MLIYGQAPFDGLEMGQPPSEVAPFHPDPVAEQAPDLSEFDQFITGQNIVQGSAALWLNQNNVADANNYIRFHSTVAPNINLYQFLYYVSIWYYYLCGKYIGYTTGTPTYWIKAGTDGRTFTDRSGSYLNGPGVKTFASTFSWEFYFGLGVWLHEDAHGFREPGSPNVYRGPDPTWNGHSTDKRSIVYAYPPIRNHLIQFQNDNLGGKNGWWYGRMPVEWNSLRNMLV